MRVRENLLTILNRNIMHQILKFNFSFEVFKGDFEAKYFLWEIELLADPEKICIFGICIRM